MVLECYRNSVVSTSCITGQVGYVGYGRLWSAMVGYGRLVVDAFGVATKHTRTMNTCGNAETTVTFMHPSCAIRSDAILETNHANHCKSIYEK